MVKKEILRFNPIKLRDIYKKISNGADPPKGGYVKWLKENADAAYLEECAVYEIPGEEIFTSTLKLKVTVNTLGQPFILEPQMVTTALLKHLDRARVGTSAVCEALDEKRKNPTPDEKHESHYPKDVVQKFDFRYYIVEYMGRSFGEDHFLLRDRKTGKEIMEKTILVKEIINTLGKIYRWKDGQKRIACACFNNEKYLDADEIEYMVKNDTIIVGVSLTAPEDNFCKKCAREIAMARYFHEKRGKDGAKS